MDEEKIVQVVRNEMNVVTHRWSPDYLYHPSRQTDRPPMKILSPSFSFIPDFSRALRSSGVNLKSSDAEEDSWPQPKVMVSSSLSSPPSSMY